MLFYTARQRKHSTQKLINTHQLHLQYAIVEKHVHVVSEGNVAHQILATREK